MHQRQFLTLYFLYHHTKDGLLHLLVLREEHQSRTVMSLLRHRNPLQENEFMRYLDHDARPVARLVAGFGSTMLHVLQYLQGIVDQFVTLVAMDIHNHAHAACVMFITALV